MPITLINRTENQFESSISSPRRTGDRHDLHITGLQGARGDAKNLVHGSEIPSRESARAALMRAQQEAEFRNRRRGCCQEHPRQQPAPFSDLYFRDAAIAEKRDRRRIHRTRKMRHGDVIHDAAVTRERLRRTDTREEDAELQREDLGWLRNDIPEDVADQKSRTAARTDGEVGNAAATRHIRNSGAKIRAANRRLAAVTRPQRVLDAGYGRCTGLHELAGIKRE